MALPEIIKDIEARVKDTGDTMTGTLQLQPADSEGCAKIYKNANAGGDYGLQMQDIDPDGNFMGLTVSGKLQKLELKKKKAGDSEYTYTKVYDEDYPPSPEDVNAVPIWGGTMTGALTLSGNPYQDNHAATKAYVDAKISSIPTPDVSGQINTHNTSTTAHNDIRTLITNIVNGTTTIGKATSATNATSATSATNATNATNIYSSASTAKAYVLGTTTASSANHATVYNASVYTSGSVLYGAAWNDYAEYRISDCFEAGRVICENGDDTLSIATERLQPGANVISDTFGFAIGETEEAKTPIAVSGRVLVYTYEDRNEFKAGDAVCAAPNGTVSKMTREEIREYPERIVGIVSAIPNYEVWGTGNVKVDGRIWVKIK